MLYCVRVTRVRSSIWGGKTKEIIGNDRREKIRRILDKGIEPSNFLDCLTVNDLTIVARNTKSPQKARKDELIPTIVSHVKGGEDIKPPESRLVTDEALKEALSRFVNSQLTKILARRRLKIVGSQAVQRLFKSGALQAKLKIGRSGDIYEQETDRVAEEVMRMPEPQAQRQADEKKEDITQIQPLTTQITHLVQRQSGQEEEPTQTKLLSTEQPIVQSQDGEKKEKEILQPRRYTNQTPEITPNLECCIQAMRGGGRRPPECIRTFFEPRFGQDLSRVRVHSNPAAAEMARTLNARAFTSGQDIVFGDGQNPPGTTKGRGLLTHELTHLVQQSGEVLHKLTIGRSRDACEGEAHHVAADAVMQTPEIHCQFVNVQKR